ACLEASLRALRTDYVDVLSLHEPSPSVLTSDELFAALEDLVAAGKVRWVGVAAAPQVIEAALAARPAGVRYLQFPCNLFNLGLAQRLAASAGGDLIAIANHPFGGPAGVARGKKLLNSLAAAPTTPAGLREKLRPVDDAVLADVVLNLVTGGVGIPMAVASMLRIEHLRANFAAMRNSRFDSEELSWLREAILPTQAGAEAPGS
ncbi:MAG: aldo/keto reductase, partial [Acidobacteriota bacterium]